MTSLKTLSNITKIVLTNTFFLKKSILFVIPLEENSMRSVQESVIFLKIQQKGSNPRLVNADDLPTEFSPPWRAVVVQHTDWNLTDNLCNEQVSLKLDSRPQNEEPAMPSDRFSRRTWFPNRRKIRRNFRRLRGGPNNKWTFFKAFVANFSYFSIFGFIFSMKILNVSTSLGWLWYWVSRTPYVSTWWRSQSRFKRFCESWSLGRL